MIPRICLLLGLTLAPLTACGPKRGSADARTELPVPSPDELIARAVARSGGEEAIRRHHSVEFEGEMRMAAQGIVASMRLVQVEPGTIYSRVELPGVGLMEEGVTDGVAWARDPLSGPRIKEGVERAQALRSADPDYVLNLHQHFPTMETLGLTELEGRKVWQLRLVPVEGSEEIGYFDVETGDWTGSLVTAETAMGKIKITTLNEDYRMVDDMRVPFRMRVVNSLMSSEITWTSVTLDRPDLVVPPMPEDVAALLPAAPSETPTP